MSCSKCDQDKFIVNKKYNLCDDCNYKRLHQGKSKSEVYSERASTKEKKVYVFKKKSSPIKSTKPIKQQTQKEKLRKMQLSTIKNQIEEIAIQEGKYYCWGCGKSGVPLDKSHILSVGQRKDLELDPENINLFDRECHMAWESGDIEKMSKLLTFEKDMLYIKEKDPARYNHLYSELSSYLLDGWIVDNDLYNRLLAFWQENDYIV